MDWIKNPCTLENKSSSQEPSKFIEFESERLLFRKFCAADFPTVYSWHSDTEHMSLRRDGVKDEDGVHRYLNWVISEANADECKNFWFAAVLKKNNMLIGEAILLNVPEKPELGWLVDKFYWQKGFGAEIGNSLLYFAFNVLNLRRIIAACHVDNHASYKVMEKIGMRREAHFIKEKLYGNTWCDRFQYAILREEWEKI